LQNVDTLPEKGWLAGWDSRRGLKRRRAVRRRSVSSTERVEKRSGTGKKRVLERRVRKLDKREIRNEGGAKKRDGEEKGLGKRKLGRGRAREKGGERLEDKKDLQDRKCAAKIIEKQGKRRHEKEFGGLDNKGWEDEGSTGRKQGAVEVGWEGNKER